MTKGFFRHRFFRLGDALMAAMLIIGVVWLTLVYAVTARFWFDPRSVWVADTTQGSMAEMQVDRTIKRNFHGSYTATVRVVPGMTVVCDAVGSVSYSKDSTLPKPLTLRWWAHSDSRCHGSNLPVGDYILDTCWIIEQPFKVLPNKTVCTRSNQFRVQPVYGQQTEINRLKQQLDTLQRKLGVTK